jgi:hypothetical protein
MATDQRYCVVCGARRGKARFTTESVQQSEGPAPVRAAEAAPPPAPRSQATGVFAGVATLVLTMGVGFLIGHASSANAPTKAAAPQVITVGGVGAAATPSASASPTSKSHGKHASAKSSPKVKVVHLSPKAKKSAAAAAAKTLGGSAPKDPTVQVGQSCTPNSAGCDSSGHFSGSFFGG